MIGERGLFVTNSLARMAAAATALWAIALRGLAFCVIVLGLTFSLSGRPAAADQNAQAPCAHNEPRPTSLPTSSASMPPWFSPQPVRHEAEISTGIYAREFGISAWTADGVVMQLHAERARLILLGLNGRAVAGNRLQFDPCIPIALSDQRGLRAALPDYWLGFHLNTDGLAPGLYRITVSLQPGFATSASGQSLPVTLDPWRPSLAVYVSPTARIPQLVPGQRFIALEAPIGSLRAAEFTDSHGVIVSGAEMWGRILTLTRLDATSAEFRAEGIAGPLYLPRPADATRILGLYPLVADETVDRLKAKYLGKRVWGYGGLDVFSDDRMGTSYDGLPILGIYRAYGYGRTLNVGGPFETSNVNVLTYFVALDPLVIRFGGSALSSVQPLMGTPIPQHLPTYAIVSDTWDFERLYSLASIADAHPSWSAAILSKIRNGKIEKGMTKDMIAWMFGYPSIYGTLEQVRQLDVWEYEQPAPFSYTVRFRNGVVVKYDPPGNLP